MTQSNVKCSLWIAFLMTCCLVVRIQAFDYDNDQSTTPSLPPSSHSGVIIPAVILVLLFATLFGTIAYKYKSDNTHRVINAGTGGPPEEQMNLVLCTLDNVVHEYNLIFRVGCPTDRFDMKHGYIDFEILGPEDEIIGCPVRFDTSLLPNYICGEMHCLIGRITPMPEINGIRARHNDRNGGIFFYEYDLVDMADDSVLETRRFNVYITNRVTTYRGTVYTGEEDDDEAGPTLPLMEWTTTEIAIISTLLVMIMGSVVMLIEYFNLYPSRALRREDGSLYRAIFDVLFASLIGLVAFLLVSALYKYYLKRRVLRLEYSLNQTHLPYWRYVCKVYLYLLVAISLTLSVVFIFFGLRISLIKSFYWLGAWLISCSLVLGIWTILNSCLCVKRFLERDSVAAIAGLSRQGQKQSKAVYANSDSRSHQHTVFFKADSVSIVNSLGPKLMNPKKAFGKTKTVIRKQGKALKKCNNKKLLKNMSKSDSGKTGYRSKAGKKKSKKF